MRNGKLILLLSGEICTGKSKLCENLEKRFGFKILKTKEALKQISHETKKKQVSERVELQKFGENLDKETSGAWVRNFFQKEVINNDRVVIDAARIMPQIDAFRQSYGHIVFHIHLKASSEELRKRFLKRRDIEGTDAKLLQLYEEVKNDKTEKNVNQLEKKADIVIDTERNEPEDVLVRVAGFLKILPLINNQLVDVLIGGQFGSEGKGQVAAYLAPNYDCLVRVGGPNAGHKVFAEPEPHVFHLLPSGSVKNEKAKLIIGAGAVISKEVLLDEIQRFNINEPERLLIDSNATVITNADKAYEKKFSKIGSTNQGVGKATANNILARLKGESKFKAKYCKELSQYIGSTHEEFEKLFSQNKRILLEVTKGYSP